MMAIFMGSILSRTEPGSIYAYYSAGNGRLARNMVEQAILNQSRRLVAEPEADLSTLLLKDFEIEAETEEETEEKTQETE